jgi:ribosomal protein L17
MTTNQKKKQIKSFVKEMIKKSQKEQLQAIDKALNSGALDIENWNPERSPMVLPKIVVTAILEEAARQYTGRGTPIEKQVRKEINNLKMFL